MDRIDRRVGLVSDNGTIGQEHDSVGERCCHGVMGDHHDRLAKFLYRLLHELQDLVPGCRVQVARWFVGEDDAGSAGESPSHGDPLLLEKRMGSGKLLLLATALNTAWTNLPVESVFVAFILQSIDYLAGDTTGVSYRSTGEAISIAPGSQLLDPNGEPMRDLSKISERATITLNEPGIYTVRNSAGARPVAVNSDVRESDITIIDDTTLQNWQEMATNPAANNRNSQTSTSNRRGFWIWLLPLLLVIALLESLYSHKHLWIRREA